MMGLLVMKLSTIFVSLVFSMLLVQTAFAGLEVPRLRTEYLTNPLGIDCPQPRLQWQLESNERGQKQTAYRILVAGSLKSLAAKEADLWDSGKVPSDASTQIAFAGRLVASGQECF